MPTFKNILCPVDFSSSSQHALTVAKELANSFGASLTLVHVWQLPVLGPPEAQISGDVLQSFIDDAQRMLAEATAGAVAGGVKGAQSKFIVGVPWNEIVRLAADSAADLIAMGTNGRTGLKHVLIGSVAEKVVRHAPCAVLVLR